MVVAKTDRAHQALSEAFADHGRDGDLERAYLALVWGTPARDRAPSTRRSAAPATACARRRAGGPRRRPPCRHPLHRAGALSARAGRTSHGLARRMPAGDRPHAPDPRPYGAYRPSGDRRPRLRHRHSAPRPTACRAAAHRPSKRFPRQALHAWLLAFRHPQTQMLMRFEAPMPADMAGLVEAEFRASEGDLAKPLFTST